MFSSLVSLLSGGLLGGVKDIVTAVGGNQQERDQQAAADQAALRSQFQAEFSGAEKTGWWNSLVDGLNRLVRPLFTYGVISLFIWCYIDPIEFAAAMTSLQLVPEPLWVILGSIVIFWFGGRTLEGMKAVSGSARTVQAVTAQLAELRAMQPAAPQAPPPAEPSSAAAAPTDAGSAPPPPDDPPHPVMPHSTNWAVEQYMQTRANAA